MKENDEYNWPDYHREYVGQLNELRKKDGLDFFITHFTANETIIFHDNLHPNWKELYSTIYELKPKSVFEVGCGGCYHIKNIVTILPLLEGNIGGMDLLGDQLRFGISFADLPISIARHLLIGNFTDSEDVKKIAQGYELVYSHAVVMHMGTENAVRTLQNMAKVSYKYILLIEGLVNHENWFDLVKETLPDWEFCVIGNYIDNSILLTKKYSDDKDWEKESWRQEEARLSRVWP